MTYAEHITRICKINDIELVLVSWGNGCAFRRKRKIRIRPVKTDVTYAVALHEIGHILGPRQSGTRLYKEVGAWEWAKANAREWTDKMEQKQRECLESYLDWSMRSKKAKRADATHPIHTMV